MELLPSLRLEIVVRCAMVRRVLTDRRSGDKIHLPDHGIRRPRHGPGQSHHGHRLPRLRPDRTRNPSPRLRRDPKGILPISPPHHFPPHTPQAYPNTSAWHASLHEEKIPYLTALYKEILRFWTVIPISLPRVSIKDIPYEGATIPAGTTFYMNAYAADYDPAHFASPDEFLPDRFLGDTAGTPHYSYGAGSRMCVGSHLANRELFTAFVRLILAFEFVPPKNPA